MLTKFYSEYFCAVNQTFKPRGQSSASHFKSVMVSLPIYQNKLYSNVT